LTPAALLVLAFLDLHPPPVCTLAFPQGAVTIGESCPSNNVLNGFGMYGTLGGLRRCVRRFKI
jgi:hypothetical protein